MYNILSMVSVVGVVVSFLYIYIHTLLYQKKLAFVLNFAEFSSSLQAMVIACSLGMGPIPWLIMSEVS